MLKYRAKRILLVMRIITGSAKGAKLKAPRGLDTRPTADRVKESVFNILGSRVEAAQVLDLFAGTGNLGLEALSRGALRAVFIDRSAASVAVIKENALHTRLISQTSIIKSDVGQTLDRLERSGQIFTLVFCDPPYNRGLVQATLTQLATGRLLAENSIIVVEHSQHEAILTEWTGFPVTRTECYGETRVSFLSCQ